MIYLQNEQSPGSLLKKLRLQRGMTQKEVAELTGISVPAISMYEREKRKIPIQTYEKILKSLNATYGVIIE